MLTLIHHVTNNNMEYFLIGASIGTICVLIYWFLSPKGEDDRLKREEFAMAAMQGLLSGSRADYYLVNDGYLSFDLLAKDAVSQADALIDALNKEVTNE